MLPLNEILIKEARKLSLSADYGDEYGIPQATFVASLKKANQLLQSYLVAGLREPFMAFDEQDIVANQVAYALPTDIVTNNWVYHIQYSADGSAENYEDLVRVFEREPQESGSPETYYLEGATFYPNPVPSASGAKFRIRYEKGLEDLDIRRGYITAVNAGTTYWELVLADTASGLIVAADDDELADTPGDFISIIDDSAGLGTIIESAILVQAYDSTSHTLTTSDPIAGAAPATAGQYVCIGRNATCRSKLPPIARSFFVEFMKNDVYEPLSSTDSVESNPKLSAVLSQLIELYSITATAKIHIPERRGDY